MPSRRVSTLQIGQRIRGSTGEAGGLSMSMKRKPAEPRGLCSSRFALLFAGQLELNNERIITLRLLSEAQVSPSQFFKLDL